MFLLGVLTTSSLSPRRSIIAEMSSTYSILFSLLTVLTEAALSTEHLINSSIAVESNTERPRRQSKYICGTEDMKFYSEFPCNMYPLCATGGFKMHIGCTTDIQCQLHIADTECIDACCCTIPRMLEETTTPKRFLDQSSSSCSYVIVLTISLIPLVLT